MDALIEGIVSKLGELVVESTMKQCEYFNHKKIIGILKEENSKLEGIKIALQAWVDAKRWEREEVEPNIVNWLSKVKTFETELQSFLENKVKKNNEKCPIKLAFKYSLGKQAMKKMEYIRMLKVETTEFKLISVPKPLPTLGSTFSTEDIKSIESRNKKIREVIENLNDVELKRIGICGMGGVGKTTLVKKVIQIIDNVRLFDKIVMVVVSQNPEYEKIQSQIADGISYAFKSVSIEGRGRELFEKMKEIIDCKKVLIVLDDVWNELNFDLIGLPSRDCQKGSKLLFTSRFENVCLKMGSQKNTIVSVLVQDEAWYLFQAMAGDVVYRPHIHPIAKLVAKECGGLPLAIVTVGKALENEEEQCKWEYVLEQLQNSQSSSLYDFQKTVYSSIELSFNFLGSRELKFLLMLCVLFPEDFDIPIEKLLRHAVGLGLFKGGSVVGAPWKVARNQVHTLVGDLKKFFFLLASDVPGCVKMHDIVHDVVKSIAFKSKERRFVVEHDLKSITSLKEEKLDDINAISLILNKTADELENDDSSSESEEYYYYYPSLQLLHVQSNSKEQKFWPQQYSFRGMTALKVLSMQNLFIPKLPSLSKASLNLHTLQVEHCDVNGDISIIGKELIHLHVLSFAHSNIKHLPAEIGNLNSLGLLDLTGCNNLNFISPNIFAKLSRLEELYLRMDNFPWKKHDLVIKEMESMSHRLKVVEMKCRASDIFGMNLDFKNLDKFWVYVDAYTNFERSAYLESNVLQLSGMDYKCIKSLPMPILQLIIKCEILDIRWVTNMKNVISQLVDCLPLFHLKDLRVSRCRDLVHIIDCTTVCSNAFPQIQSLSLRSLDNLREICYTSPPPPHHHEVKVSMIDQYYFSNLLELELLWLPRFIGFSQTNNDLNACHQEQRKSYDEKELSRVMEGALSFESQLESAAVGSLTSSSINGNNKLFPSDWMLQFPKLKTILVESCSSINLVFDMQLESCLDGQVFRQLDEIYLGYLDQLTNVWSRLAMQKKHVVQGFKNLKSLTISHCNSLRYVFTPTIVKAITKFEKLEIDFCDSLEYLVLVDEDEDDVISWFKKLDSLKLGKLPSITGVCANSYYNELQYFPSLRKLEIDNCPMLDISFWLTTYTTTKHHNFSSSYNNSNNIEEENYSTNSHLGMGSTPLCSKLIPRRRQSSQSKKNNKATCNINNNSEEKKMKIEVGRRAPLLEEVWIQNFNKLFPQDEEKADQSTRIRYDEKTIDFGLLFPNLKSLNMSLCDNITVLLSPSSARCLMCLEKLSLANCENLKNIIFDHDDEKIQLEAKSIDENNKITFPKLQHLFLMGLPNFKAFCQGPYHLDFPSLEKVEVEGCPNIELFSKGSSHTHMLEEVQINGKHYTQKMKKDINTIMQEYKTLVTLQIERSEMLPWIKLRDKGIVGWIVKESTMEIESFDSLSMLFPLNEIQILQHVRKLSVKKCASLVELFESTKEKEDTLSSTTFHTQVEEIYLYNLPKLSHIWKHTKEVVGFQKVRNIEIIGCHNLRSLFSCSMAKRLVNLQVLVVESCDILEKIIVRNKEDEEEEEKESSKLIIKIYFSKLEVLELKLLPQLECFGLGGDYNEFDIPFYDDGGDNQEINIDKVQIVFPKLKRLTLFDVPSLRCFYSGEYDYDIMVSSSIDVEQWYTFFHGNNNNVILSTPSLFELDWFENSMDILGDLNLTIHYLVHLDKYRGELRKLETLRDIELDEQLAGYIKRERELHFEKCHKLLKYCIPYDKMHLFSHVEGLDVLECECLKEIFEESSSTNTMNINVDYGMSSSGLGLKNLQTIKIVKCHDLRYVLQDVSMVKSLPNLSWLEVDECNNMKEIIGRNTNSIISKEAKIIFPFLFEIHLTKLPSLQCFGQSGFPCYVEMPWCRNLMIDDCPLMNTFWYNGTIYTPLLEYLWVEGVHFSIYDEINEILSFQKNNPSSTE